MFKFQFVLFTILLHCSVTAQKEDSWVICGKERPNDQSMEASPPFTGYRISYTYIIDSTGRIDSLKKEEGNYVNDKKEGVFIKYHSDGKTPKLIEEFENNRPKGKYQKFWFNGKLKEAGTFTKNMQLDSMKRYSESGILEYEAFFNENGKEEAVRYYHENGQLEFVYVTNNGTPTDTAYRYYNNGDLKEWITYDAEGRINNIKEFDAIHPLAVIPEKPKPTQKKACYTDNNYDPNGYNKLYNEEGELIYDGNFKDGVLVDGKVYEYDANGFLLQVIALKAGEQKVEKKK